MSNIRYLNQSAPFWDWVANLEDYYVKERYNGESGNRQARNRDDDNQAGPSGSEKDKEKDRDNETEPPPVYSDEDMVEDLHNEKSPPNPPPPPGGPEDLSHPPPPPPGPPPPPHHHHGGPHGGPHGWHRGPPGFGGRGGRCHRGGGAGCGGGEGRFRGRHGGPWGWWGRQAGGPFGQGFPFGPHGGAVAGGGFPNLDPLFDFARAMRNGGGGGNFGSFGASSNSRGRSGPDGGRDFTPPVDVFDAPDAFVVHVSLPGAQKEDLGVRWEPEASELVVAGVVHRPGDEELLSRLALDERDVGAFERRVRLGSRAHPAAVDADAITARMEAGVLVVRVPRAEEFVEVKKVDVE